MFFKKNTLLRVRAGSRELAVGDFTNLKLRNFIGRQEQWTKSVKQKRRTLASGGCRAAGDGRLCRRLSNFINFENLCKVYCIRLTNRYHMQVATKESAID
jgi:hypothetical protein